MDPNRPNDPPLPSETADVVVSAACKASEVPIGAHVRDPSSGAWQQVADVVRVRDGSGVIRLTLANGERFTAGPNDAFEIRDAAEGV